MGLLTQACGGAAQKPYLYGPESCEGNSNSEELAPYPTVNGQSVVCLPKENVSFMLCVRELGLSETTIEDTIERGGKMSIPKLEVELGGDTKATNAISQKWAAEGRLADARAAALKACILMLPNEKQQLLSVAKQAVPAEVILAPVLDPMPPDTVETPEG